MSNTKSNAPTLIAYQVDQVGEKTYWHRIGAAWKNAKDGYKIKLSAMPIDGEIILMPPQDKKEEQGAA